MCSLKNVKTRNQTNTTHTHTHTRAHTHTQTHRKNTKTVKAAGCSGSEAQSVCVRLGREATAAVERVERQRKQKQNEQKQRAIAVKVESFVSKGGVQRLRMSAEDVVLTLNRNHFDKLSTLFRRTCASSDGMCTPREAPPSQRQSRDQNFTAKLNEHVMCVLLRYASAQGASNRGGGYQAAAPEHVFDVLRDMFGVSFECFASPLNCRFARFCSAFGDVDAAFGSCGNFFDFFVSSEGGSFEANPPFEPKIISDMAQRMDLLLSTSSGAVRSVAAAEDVADERRELEPKRSHNSAGAATMKSKKSRESSDSRESKESTHVEPKKSQRPLQFIVFVPHWPHEQCWKALNASPFCRFHLLLPKFEHMFVEGDQHVGFSSLNSRYTLSVYDTSVFFLQNRKAKKLWPITDEKVQRLVAAFQPTDRAKKLSERRKQREALGQKTNGKQLEEEIR